MRDPKVPAPAAGGDRVAARFAMLRNPHPAVELTAAPHSRVDGGHASELVPVREGLREQCHPLPLRTAIGRAAHSYQVARLDPVGTNVDRGPGGEGSGREREHEGGGETEGEPARRRVDWPAGLAASLARGSSDAMVCAAGPVSQSPGSFGPACALGVFAAEAERPIPVTRGETGTKTWEMDRDVSGCGCRAVGRHADPELTGRFCFHAKAEVGPMRMRRE